MILTAIFGLVSNLLIFLFGFIFLPFRLFLPGVSIQTSVFTDFANFMLNTFNSVQNIFIYFSSQSAWRFLVISLLIDFVIFPLITPVVTVVRKIFSLVRSLKP